MADELMMPIDYTPTTDVVRHVATFPRLRLGEPRHMTPEAFDHWVESVRQEERERIAQAIRDDLTCRPLAGHDGIRDAALIAEGKCVPPAQIARGTTR